jgi:biotin synthase-like enzyme
MSDLSELARLADHLDEIRVLRLQPGDVLVATPRRELDHTEVGELLAGMKAAFPGCEVRVVSGLTLDVVRAEEPDPPPAPLLADPALMTELPMPGGKCS